MTAEEQIPTLALEGGATLFNADHLRQGQEEQARVTARGIARALDLMQVRAAGIAPRDLTAGVDFLRDLDRSHSLSWLSMNLVDRKTEQTVFAPFKIVTVGGIRIGLLGLTDVQARAGDRFRLLPWEDVLPGIVEQLAERTDMIILLSSYPESVNTRIARSQKNIHIILQAGHRAVNQSPKQVNNTLLCRTGARGKYQGMLRISWNREKTWGESLEDRRKKVQSQLDRISWQLHRLEKRLPREQLRSEIRYNRLLRQREELETTLQGLATDRTATSPCTYRNRLIALKTSLPEDPEVGKIVDEIRVTVNRLNRKMLSRSRQQADSPLQAVTGWRKCAECHPEQADFWLQTGHATAWQTLAEADQEFNRECLVCHVTLPSYKSQQPDLTEQLSALDRSLKNVGCESCHGPGREHARSPETALMAAINTATCLQCHTAEHDDHFDFREKLNKIRCPAAGKGGSPATGT